LRIAAAGWRICGSPNELCLYTPAAGSLSRQVLRFAAAELANARKVSSLLQLPSHELRRKELSIFDEYGLELLHLRDLTHARKYFWQSLRTEINVRRALRCAATFLPRGLLDLRRAASKSLRGGRCAKIAESETTTTK